MNLVARGKRCWETNSTQQGRALNKRTLQVALNNSLGKTTGEHRHKRPRDGFGVHTLDPVVSASHYRDFTCAGPACLLTQSRGTIVALICLIQTRKAEKQVEQGRKLSLYPSSHFSPELDSAWHQTLGQCAASFRIDGSLV